MEFINKQVIISFIAIVSTIVVYIINVLNTDSAMVLTRIFSEDTPSKIPLGILVRYNKHNRTSKWVAVGKEDYFIFSVIAEEILTSSTWRILVFNGLERLDMSNRKYKCCFRYSDGTITSVISENKRYKFTNGPYPAAQIVCDISNKPPPYSATLVSLDANCNSDGTYLSPIYRHRDPSPKLAICGKVAYGSKNSQEVIEWMEFHLHFGGGPFIIYEYENLNVDTVKVLEYYESRGVLEIVYLPYEPNIGPGSPKWDAVANAMYFDFQQRARHFSAYSMIDIDEFIVPTDGNMTSYVQLVDFLLKKHPKAGYLSFRTVIHLKDWGQTDPNSKLIIGQYEFHSEPRPLTVKNIYLPERNQAGTMWVHSVQPLPGFTRIKIDPTDVVLKHYRYCKEKWFLSTQGRVPCLSHFKKIRGHTMKKMAKQIEINVLDVIKLLDLPLATLSSAVKTDNATKTST